MATAQAAENHGDEWDLTWNFWYNLIPFVQFKKPEKHPWRSVTFNTNRNASSKSVPHVF